MNNQSAPLTIMTNTVFVSDGIEINRLYDLASDRTRFRIIKHIQNAMKRYTQVYKLSFGYVPTISVYYDDHLSPQAIELRMSGSDRAWGFADEESLVGTLDYMVDIIESTQLQAVRNYKTRKELSNE